MYSQIIEAQTKGKNWISSSQEKYFVWLSNFILLERIFSFIYSQAADGGLEFSVLNDGDPTASPSESKPTNTGKLLKIQNSSRTRVEHLIRIRFELPPSNTWMNYYTCSQDTLFHYSSFLLLNMKEKKSPHQILSPLCETKDASEKRIECRYRVSELWQWNYTPLDFRVCAWWKVLSVFPFRAI